jgi:phage-related tail protein
MKATLEFDLQTEEDEHRDALNGTKWKGVVRDIDEQLRLWLKHGNQFEDANDAIENLRTYLRGSLDEEGLTLH